MSVGNRLRRLVGLGAEGRERLVSAALDLLDEAGLEGLTMRTLAERLGMRAASLYWHIRDKEQLLGLLAEAIVAEVPEPASDLPWRAQLEAFATDYRDVLRSHRDGARVVMAARPAAPRQYERLVRTLLAAGFDGEVAVDACHLLAGTFVPAAVAEESELGVPPNGDYGELRVPLGRATRGRLEITNGVAGMTLRADPALAELCAGRFQGKPPTVQVEGGTVRITLHHKRLQLRTHTADLALNPAVPWDVDISSGVWRLRADLRGLRLGSFSVSSGTADMTLLLPPPEGTVPVRVSGGAHKLTIHRPPGVAARIRVGSGVHRLTLDTLHLGSAGETRWETPDFEAASGRYDVEIDGGASQLVFDAALEAEDEPAGTPVPAGTAGAAASGWAEALSAEEYPTLAPLAGRLANPDPDARFEFGLQVLLDGLEPRLAPG
ncbi:MAG TPA: TetR/AcrR family transcriptional regulator C-terminal domain-containing protein [Candidatus Dormibacteraeota bacterium]|nr:TetR/AcrR family transcriptional regulator C-terminal domain-containing protein [Candidatus Dormibacteraeota bacterium]